MFNDTNAVIDDWLVNTSPPFALARIIMKSDPPLITIPAIMQSSVRRQIICPSTVRSVDSKIRLNWMSSKDGRVSLNMSD